MKNLNKYVLSAILAAVAYVIYNVLSKIINPVIASLIGSGIIVILLLTFILTLAGIWLTVIGYYKLIEKKNVSSAKVTSLSITIAIIRSLLILVPVSSGIISILAFVVLYVGILVILTAFGKR